MSECFVRPFESLFTIKILEPSDPRGFSFCIRNKDISEWSEKSPVRGPIGDGEHHVGESAAKVVFERSAEIDRGSAGIIGKSTTAPGTENECRIAEGFCDRRIEPFQWFQSFHRCARFKPSD
jgi:hypothetical protein